MAPRGTRGCGSIKGDDARASADGVRAGAPTPAAMHDTAYAYKTTVASYTYRAGGRPAASGRGLRKEVGRRPSLTEGAPTRCTFGGVDRRCASSSWSNPCLVHQPTSCRQVGWCVLTISIALPHSLPPLHAPTTPDHRLEHCSTACFRANECSSCTPC